MFLRDLEEGRAVEAYVRALLAKGGLSPEPNTARTRGALLKYDILFHLDGRKRLAEVKFDRMAARTGNLALEYWNSRQDKASGLLATGADIWVHVLPNPLCVYAVGTEVLFDYVSAHKPLRTVENAGDGNAGLLLYRAADILPAFVGLDVTAPQELSLLIRHLVEENQCGTSAGSASTRPLSSRSAWQPDSPGNSSTAAFLR